MGFQVLGRDNYKWLDKVAGTGCGWCGWPGGLTAFDSERYRKAGLGNFEKILKTNREMKE
ncbi:hypothetical protein CGRA01v4_14272 [Colletotrichum graminicola]|nr:hypothetical protein CGRA01v4_14272 [Colletotrichum graminicola]